MRRGRLEQFCARGAWFGSAAARSTRALYLMMRFAEFVTRRKAWQIFVALVAPVFIAQFYLVAAIPLPSSMGQPPDVMLLAELSRRMMAVTLLMFVLFFSWLISVGWIANHRIDPSIRPRMRWYLAAAIYAPAYVALAACFFPGSLATGGGLPGIVVAMHLLAMVAIFYILGFSAKNLIMAERQMPVSFFDYSGPLFLMWFFPIGIWFVQPRVNKLVAAT